MGPPLRVRNIEGVRTSEASGVFPVGVAMRTCALRRRVVELSLAVRLRERLTRG